ncbi:hypothetical protein [Glutamicibacter sp.]|uniref:hypothetical protein n=1 Tax=Glutamicibacter sp. TaxID=1931995 RepID=UPI002B45A25A|nr:hypothetical protein [Glutamicibacter sp.]HJX76699.1 hypothetical protein [Glutamicibacter sp.]
MWKTNGARQRVILAVVGLILVAAGAALYWGRWNAPNTDQPVLSGLDHGAWSEAMPSIVIYTSLFLGLLAVASLIVILSTFPRKPSNQKFIYRSKEQSGISRIDTGVISRAAQDAAKVHPELLDASIRIGGSTESPVLYAWFTLRVDASPIESMNLVRSRLIPDMEAALGRSFTQKHVKLDFGFKKSESDSKVTLN